MATTALDSYMHWLVVMRVSEVRKNGDLPKALKKYQIPFEDLATMAESTVAQRKKGKVVRPWVQAKNSLQRKILTDTFQSFEEVGAAFALAGIAKPWKNVATEMGTTADAIKTRLNGIVHRRNQIVHEGDIKRSPRPRKLRFNDVNHQAIEDDIDWMERLIGAIEKTIT